MNDSSRFFYILHKKYWCLRTIFSHRICSYIQAINVPEKYVNLGCIADIIEDYGERIESRTVCLSWLHLSINPRTLNPIFLESLYDQADLGLSGSTFGLLQRLSCWNRTVGAVTMEWSHTLLSSLSKYPPSVVRCARTPTLIPMSTDLSLCGSSSFSRLGFFILS